MTMNPRESIDVAVIGGGVIGSAIAFRLRRQGLSVCLIDRGGADEAASFGNAGHVASELIFPFASWSTIWSVLAASGGRNAALTIRPAYLLPALPWLLRFIWAARPQGFRHGVAALQPLLREADQALARLLNEAGAGNLLRLHGSTVIAETRKGARTLAALNAASRHHQLACTLLTGQRLQARMPQIAPAATAALAFANGGHVADPWSVVLALQAAFSAAGGDLRRAEVTTIERQPDDAVDVRLAGGSAIRARQVVVAAGVWSAPLMRSLGVATPLEAERGYHLSYPGAQLEQEQSTTFLERRVVTTPMAFGARITGWVEFAGLEAQPDPAKFARLDQHFNELYPGATIAPPSAWMGRRPSLPDHLPAIGRLQRAPNVIACYGHQHLGLTLAGISAELVTAIAARQALQPTIAAFNPERFSR